MLKNAAVWFLDKIGGACVGAGLTALIQLGALAWLRDITASHPLLTPVLVASSVTAMLCVAAVFVHQASPGLPVVRYAGWGKGPGEQDLIDVTKVLQGHINNKTPDLKASDRYFSWHYQGAPRMLLVRYSIGGTKKTRAFAEHNPVRLD